MVVTFSTPGSLDMDEVVLVPGLGGMGTTERYHWIDLRGEEVRTTEIDITPQRQAQAAVLEHNLSASLPYGLTSITDLLPYFLHPHSFFSTRSGEVVVSFKQAPYFRILRPSSHTLYPAEPDFTTMLSSTSCEVGDRVVAYTAVQARDRYARYAGRGQLFGGSIRNVDLATGDDRLVAEMPPFIRDTLHQLSHSDAGFYVGTDMSLDVADGGLDDMTDGFDLEVYAAAEFPRSGFFVHDESTGSSATRLPGTACAAHVVHDPVDATIFYISCHNISKWQNQVVVHGPGALEKYRYHDGKLIQLGVFSDATYYRVTSQEVFLHDGRVMAAACAYPNHLYLIDAETMTQVDRIELFEAPIPWTPFACDKNTPAPLYLAVSPDGAHIVMSGATEFFVIDVAERKVVLRVPFAGPGEFAATAHIGLAPRSFVA